MIEMTTVDKEGRAKIEPVILVPKDYVQVVRCKDCKWYKTETWADNYYCTFRRTWQYTDEDDFCSHGERKKE